MKFHRLLGRALALAGLLAIGGAGLALTATTVLAWSPVVLTLGTAGCTSGHVTVSGGGSDVSDYNVTVEQSTSASFTSPVTTPETSTTEPYSFSLSLSNGVWVRAEWTSDTHAGWSNTVELVATGCVTPPPTLSLGTAGCSSGQVTVSFGESADNYNVTVEQSTSASFTSPVTTAETHATEPYSFSLSLSNGVWVRAEWTSDTDAGWSNTVELVATGCVTPPPTTTKTTTPTTTKTTTAASLGGPLTTSVTDTATVAQVTGSTVPAGTVTFDLYDTANCSDTPVFGTVAETLRGGTATSSPGFAPLAAGTYYWTASYTPTSGSGFAVSSSPCGADGESVTITPASGTGAASTTVTPTPTPTPVGAAKAASTLTTPTTGADLFLPGLLAAFASLFGGLLLMAGVRLRRRPTV